MYIFAYTTPLIRDIQMCRKHNIPQFTDEYNKKKCLYGSMILLHIFGSVYILYMFDFACASDKIYFSMIEGIIENFSLRMKNI